MISFSNVSKQYGKQVLFIDADFQLIDGEKVGLDSTLLMTSHDKDFMNRIVTKVIEIDGGDIITYSGDYDFYVTDTGEIPTFLSPAANQPKLLRMCSLDLVRRASKADISSVSGIVVTLDP